MKRNIQQLTELYIDKKIGNDLIVPAKDTNPHALHLMALSALIGIREEGGNNSGQLVQSIQATIGKAEKHAWCASLQQAAIAYVEKKTDKRCTVPVSEHCLTMLNEAGKIHLSVKDPVIGDLIVWQHGNTSSGHIGAIIEDGDEFVRTVEGNTGPDRRVSREGDGVYSKIRSLKGHGDMKVVGFIRVEFLVRE